MWNIIKRIVTGLKLGFDVLILFALSFIFLDGADPSVYALAIAFFILDIIMGIDYIVTLSRKHKIENELKEVEMRRQRMAEARRKRAAKQDALLDEQMALDIRARVEVQEQNEQKEEEMEPEELAELIGGSSQNISQNSKE